MKVQRKKRNTSYGALMQAINEPDAPHAAWSAEAVKTTDGSAYTSVLGQSC